MVKLYLLIDVDQILSVVYLFRLSVFYRAGGIFSFIIALYIVFGRRGSLLWEMEALWIT